MQLCVWWVSMVFMGWKLYGASSLAFILGTDVCSKGMSEFGDGPVRLWTNPRVESSDIATQKTPTQNTPSPKTPVYAPSHNTPNRPTSPTKSKQNTTSSIPNSISSLQISHPLIPPSRTPLSPPPLPLHSAPPPLNLLLPHPHLHRLLPRQALPDQLRLCL